MRSDDPHTGCRERLLAAELGLLDEADARRHAEHLAVCAECRGLADALAGDATSLTETDGHIPPAVLARWDDALRTAGRFEREMLERHLASCDPCRVELVQLARLRPRLVPLGARGAAPAARPSRVTTWWAAAATVAAVVLAVTLSRTVPTPSPAPSPAPARVTAASARLMLVPPAIHLRAPLRDADAHRLEGVELGPGGGLTLGFEPADMPDDTPVLLRVIAPDGSPLATLACLQRDLSPQRSLVIVPGAAPFALGRYELEVVSRPAAAPPETLALAFEVHAAAR